MKKCPRNGPKRLAHHLAVRVAVDRELQQEAAIVTPIGHVVDVAALYAPVCPEPRAAQHTSAEERGKRQWSPAAGLTEHAIFGGDY